LVTIGGDDTALSSSYVAEKSGGEIHTVHVPKTIDNDLPLPNHIPTFGFQTARHVGVELVRNLMEDARSTKGYIWDYCKAAGVGYRSYGEFVGVRDVKIGGGGGDAATASATQAQKEN
jgi:6-phosphofructokinase 1